MAISAGRAACVPFATIVAVTLATASAAAQTTRTDVEVWPSVRDHIRNEVQAAFKARRLSSEIFVMVGGNWAWGAHST